MTTYAKVIVIEVSTVCNLSCPFCAHDKSLKLKPMAINLELLTAFVHAVGEYANTLNGRILISWIGGEPLLLKSVIELTENLYGQYPLAFSATTNSTTLSNPFVRAHIKQCYSELTISVDGTPSFHDAMRGRVGLFDELKTSVMLLINEAPNLKVRVNIVLMKRNFDGFKALCLELASWGITEITFNQLGGRDRPEFYPENRLTIQQATNLPSIVADISEALPITTTLVSSSGYFKRIAASANDIKLPIQDCGAGDFYMFVNAKGVIAPCAFTTNEYGENITDLTESLPKLLMLPTNFQDKKKSSQSKACEDCPCTNVHGKFE